MARVVFLQSRKGTSKKGNAYQMVTLAQILDDEGNKVFVNDFFVDAEKDFTGFKFGDEVDANFVASAFIGGKPELESLTMVKGSPYIKKIQEEVSK